MTAAEYTKKGKHLPDFLQNFHDQKDLFKAMYRLYQGNESFDKLPNSWIDNQVFVIDFFLWFMSLHGYKLQRIRSNVDAFFDLEGLIEEDRQKSADALAQTLNQRLSNPGKRYTVEEVEKELENTPEPDTLNASEMSSASTGARFHNLLLDK